MKAPECLIYLAEVLYGPGGDIKAKISKLDPTIKKGLLDVNELARTMGAEITSRQIVALFVYFFQGELPKHKEIK